MSLLLSLKADRTLYHPAEGRRLSRQNRDDPENSTDAKPAHVALRNTDDAHNDVAYKLRSVG